MKTPTITTEKAQVFETETHIAKVSHNGNISIEKKAEFMNQNFGTLYLIREDKEALELLKFTVEHLLHLHNQTPIEP